jgi:hypothetical protein
MVDTTSPKVLRTMRNDALTAGQIRDRTGLAHNVVMRALHRLQASGEVTRERETGLCQHRDTGRADVWSRATVPQPTATTPETATRKNLS